VNNGDGLHHGLHHGLLVNNGDGLDHGLLNDSNLGLSRGLNVGNLLVVEVRLHHEVTSMSALEHKLNTLLDGASRGKHTEGHVGVTEGLTV